VFFAVAAALFLAAGLAAGLAWPFLAAVAAVALQFAWQTLAVDLDDPADCLGKFKSNRWAGWILLAGLALAGFA
jgi:4-hydroxybenzoate polyprenyltransferase